MFAGTPRSTRTARTAGSSSLAMAGKIAHAAGEILHAGGEIRATQGKSLPAQGKIRATTP